MGRIIPIAGVAMFMASILLLSPPPGTPYREVIIRAYAGMGLAVAGGILMVIWMWRRR